MSMTGESPVETDGVRLRLWVLTDGKIGDDVQCLAVAAALCAGFEKRVVAPRDLFAMFAPWGPLDPREAPGRQGGPLAGPAPDIAVISGRRAIPHARALKKASLGKTRIVILKDPRFGRGVADALWAPARQHFLFRHDRIGFCGTARATAKSTELVLPVPIWASC